MNDEQRNVDKAIALARAPIAWSETALADATSAVLAQRPIRVVPARWALAACIVLFVLGAIAGSALQLQNPRNDARIPVTFVMIEPNSTRISVVGDFNDWRPGATYLAPRGDGVWTVTLQLEPGRYSYAFLVDDVQWRRDPAAPTSAGEDFGRPSSVIVVENRNL